MFFSYNSLVTEWSLPYLSKLWRMSVYVTDRCVMCQCVCDRGASAAEWSVTMSGSACWLSPRHGLWAAGVLPASLRDRGGTVSQPRQTRQADTSSAQGWETEVSFTIQLVSRSVIRSVSWSVGRSVGRLVSACVWAVFSDYQRSVRGHNFSLYLLTISVFLTVQFFPSYSRLGQDSDKQGFVTCWRRTLTGHTHYMKRVNSRSGLPWWQHHNLPWWQHHKHCHPYYYYSFSSSYYYYAFTISQCLYHLPTNSVKVLNDMRVCLW